MYCKLFSTEIYIILNRDNLLSLKSSFLLKYIFYIYYLDTILYILQVYDWHNGIEWNNVAKIGAFDWFAKMLHNECHIVWIDTPILRSLITESFNKNPLINNSEQYNLIKIGDFRDAVFPAIFNLSKRNYIGQSAINQSKHFIVRLV